MIFYCKCEGDEQLGDENRDKISNFLMKSGLEYVEVGDFCDQVAGAASLIEKLTEKSSLTIIACFPRAVEWLFYAAGVGVKDKDVTYFNMREQDAETIIAGLLKNCELGQGGGAIMEFSDKAVAWFPVIDYDRCTNCGQCMDFCLFGVYERMSDKSIKVVNPGNCKDKCPACARVCPHVAIMFPKLSEKPINGAEVGDLAEENKNLKVDIQEMFGDDVYTALAARKKRSKKKLLKSQNFKKAEEERVACAAELLTKEKEECSCSCDCAFSKMANQ